MSMRCGIAPPSNRFAAAANAAFEGTKKVIHRLRGTSSAAAYASRNCSPSIISCRRAAAMCIRIEVTASLYGHAWIGRLARPGYGIDAAPRMGDMSDSDLAAAA